MVTLSSRSSRGALVTVLIAATASSLGASAGTAFALEPKSPAAAKGIKAQNDASNLVNGARQRVWTRSPTCVPKTVQAKPRTTDVAPRRATTDVIAALRRPATDDENAFRPFFAAAQVYSGHKRSVTAAGGQQFWIVPGRDPDRPAPKTAACARAEEAEISRAARKRSARVRTEVQRVVAMLRREDAAARRPVPSLDVLFLYTQQAGGGASGGGGIDLATFRTHGLFFSRGDGAGSTVHGIVPDGVATVEFDYPKLADRGALYKPVAYPSAFRTTATVQQNVVTLSVPRSAEDALAPRMTWKSASGAVIRVVKPLV